MVQRKGDCGVFSGQNTNEKEKTHKKRGMKKVRWASR